MIEKVYCPICHKRAKGVVGGEYSINGSGKFKTIIWFHKSCFEAERKNNAKRM